jgi:diguanylate cyclase (GGDEF)-like protein
MGAAYLAESYPHLAQAIVSLWQQPGEERASAETLMFGAEHGQAIADSPLGVMLTVPIRDALRGHHGHRPGPLGAIVAAADRVAELVQAPDPLSRLTAAEQAVAIAGGRTPSRELLKHAGQRVASLAGALKRPVGRQPSTEQLLQPMSTVHTTSHKRDVLAFRRGRGNPTAGGLDSLDSKAQLGAQLQACCDRSERFSILFLNFDQFGRINDTFGVPAGDLVMEALASGVRGCLSSPADRIARVGGDTFAIFMPRTGSKLGQITAERIRSMIERHHVHLGGQFRIASSVTLCGSSLTPAGAGETGSAAVIRAMSEGLRAAQRRSRNRTTWTSL